MILCNMGVAESSAEGFQLKLSHVLAHRIVHGGERLSPVLNYLFADVERSTVVASAKRGTQWYHQGLTLAAALVPSTHTYLPNRWSSGKRESSKGKYISSVIFSRGVVV